ncbi:MAG: phosphodiester glycosidase family protein, partial [Oscillospiraceae bacterium]
MLKFFKKPFRWAGVFSLFTAAFTLFVLLDTFVIPKTTTTVQAAASEEAALQSTQAAEAVAAAQITGTSYQDDSISITIETLRAYNTTYYVADIQLADPTLLKTALAGNAFGRNIKQTTTEMAEEHSANLAINGDNYGFLDDGFVLSNGVLYRSIARSDGNDDAFVMDADGNFSIVKESTTD